MTDVLGDLPSWQLSRSAARAHRLLTQGLRAAGFTGYEYRVIAAVSALGEISQAEIGRRVALDRRDVTDAVRRLEAGGIISRRADPKNARAMLVELTPHGRSEADRLARVMQEIQRAVVSPLTDSEVSRLAALLAKIGGASPE